MNTVERIKSLCKEQKIPIYKLEKDLGFANGYIGQLKKGVVPDDRIAKIAKYLGVSIPFLIGEDDRQRAAALAYEIAALRKAIPTLSGVQRRDAEERLADAVYQHGLLTENEKSPSSEEEGLSDKDLRLVKWFRSLPQEKQRAILIAQDAPADLV